MSSLNFPSVVNTGSDFIPEVKNGLLKMLPPPCEENGKVQLYPDNHTEDGAKVNMRAVFWKLHCYFLLIRS